MSYGTILIGIGVVVALAPFSGLPYSLLSILFPALGALVIILGTVVRKKQVVSPVVGSTLVDIESA